MIPVLAEIAREVFNARELLRQLVVRDLRVRYKQAALGAAWALFMPGMVVLSGVLVRYAMSQAAGAGFDRTTVATLAAKGLAWGFFAGAIGFATPSITANGGLITKVYFPREVLPLAAILAQAADTTIGLIIFLPLAALLGAHLSMNLLWVPVLVSLLFTFTVALALLLSCANVFFRDVKYIVQVLLTFGIFFTPVFYEPAMLGQVGAKLVLTLNPLAPLLEGLRLAVMEGHDLTVPLTATVRGSTVVVWKPAYLLASAAWSIGGLVVSALVFHRAERAFPEYV